MPDTNALLRLGKRIYTTLAKHESPCTLALEFDAIVAADRNHAIDLSREMVMLVSANLAMERLTVATAVTH